MFNPASELSLGVTGGLETEFVDCLVLLQVRVVRANCAAFKNIFEVWYAVAVFVAALTLLLQLDNAFGAPLELRVALF